MKERIDWAFTNHAWIQNNPHTKVYHLSRYGSDHRPILLKSAPSPQIRQNHHHFRCNAAWFLEDDFADIIRECWEPRDWEEKISQFTRKVSRWSKYRGNNFTQKKTDIFRRIEGVERARKRRDSQFLAQTERELWKEYNKLLSQEELSWYHKSRCKWLKWGDKNSRFFHTTASVRKRRNTIESLKNDNGDWISNQEGLKRLAWDYYKELFNGERFIRTNLITYSGFPQLSEEHKIVLRGSISEEEIKRATFDIGGFKAPGPDGIQAIFYQEYWHIVGQSVTDMVKSTFENPGSVCRINNTNIVLIPKTDTPEYIRDFRPISLCNVSYKVITKLLSNRLRHAMSTLVGQHQCSFIEGRQSSDNIIIAQEVIHSMRSKKGAQGWMMIKVDLEKAYDRLEWSFIRETLLLTGIEMWFVETIMACVSSSSFQVLWNGEATSTFLPSRGIRQGDPISPYLFTGRFSHIIQDAIGGGEWVPIRLRKNGPLLSHLFFADDLVLFGEASQSQAEVMMRCINRFCEASGQKMNKNKTRVYFSRNVHISRGISLSHTMGIGLTGDLGKYLGIPLLHKKASYLTFAPVIEKTKNRLSGWKRSCLNMAGRSTLIKAVLSSLPSYHMQTMLLPKGLLRDLDKLSRDFLWGDKDNARKLHLLSWDLITKDKKDGGLGIKNLEKQNHVFVMKLCWQLLTNQDAL